MIDHNMIIGDLEVEHPKILLAREQSRLEDMERLLNVVGFIKNPFAKSFSAVENLDLSIAQESINKILNNIEIYDRYTNTKLSLLDYLSQIHSVRKSVAELKEKLEQEESQK